MARRISVATVAANQRIAPHIHHMVIEAKDLALEARPGQFCMLMVNKPSTSDPLLRRPLSIAGASSHSHLEFVFRVVGRGTTLLAQAQKGDRMGITGPLGQGFPMAKDGRTVFVAGGMGLAPGLFWRSWSARASLKAQLIAGARSRDELFLIDPADSGDIGVSLATEDGSLGHRGFVTDLLKEYIEEAGDVVTILTCGPMAMMKRVHQIAQAFDLPCHCSLEATMACGMGLCLGCALPSSSGGYIHVCKEGPVVPSSMVAWHESDAGGQKSQ